VRSRRAARTPYGIALQSDIPGLKGEQEFEIILFKFF